MDFLCSVNVEFRRDLWKANWDHQSAATRKTGLRAALHCLDRRRLSITDATLGLREYQLSPISGFTLAKAAGIFAKIPRRKLGGRLRRSNNPSALPQYCSTSATASAAASSFG